MINLNKYCCYLVSGCAAQKEKGNLFVLAACPSSDALTTWIPTDKEALCVNGSLYGSPYIIISIILTIFYKLVTSFIV